MPTCLKASYVGTQSGAATILWNAAGTAWLSPYTQAKPLLVDSSADTTSCAMLTISGAEYQALLSSIAAAGSGAGGGSTGGANTMNVTADIFVGVALVVCLAVGWIAGAQR